MKKALLVHLYNKYPHCHVTDNGGTISVHGGNGKLVMQVKEVASGAYECNQKESGAKEPLDMSPIVKDGRVYKLMKDGSIGKDELADERKLKRDEWIRQHGKIPTEMEYQAGMRLKEVSKEVAPSEHA